MASAPGFFRSDQTIWAFEEDKELGKKLLAKVPMARMGKLRSWKRPSSTWPLPDPIT